MAIFDPIGLFGRLSWYAVWPVHQFVFAGMLKGIADAAGERADKNEIRRKKLSECCCRLSVRQLARWKRNGETTRRLVSHPLIVPDASGSWCWRMSADVVETSESIRRLMRDNIYYINQNRLADPADFVSDVHTISLYTLNEQQYQSGSLSEPFLGRLTANNLPDTIHELTRGLRLKMRQRPRYAISSAS